MAFVAARLPNITQRDTFLWSVARRLEVPRPKLDEELRKAEAELRRTEQQQRNYPSASAPSEATGAPDAEPLPPIEGSPIIESMLSLLLTHPELAPQVSRQLNPAWLEGRGGAEVLLQLLDAHAHDAFESAEQFAWRVDERSRDFIAGLLIEKDATKSFLQAPGRPLSDREKKLAAEFEKELKGTPAEIVQASVAILEKRLGSASACNSSRSPSSHPNSRSRSASNTSPSSSPSAASSRS